MAPSECYRKVAPLNRVLMMSNIVSLCSSWQIIFPAANPCDTVMASNRPAVWHLPYNETWPCPVHAGRQPVHAVEVEVMMLCADTCSEKRNELGYLSLLKPQAPSSASRLNTLTDRHCMQAHLWVHTMNCHHTQRNTKHTAGHTYVPRRRLTALFASPDCHKQTACCSCAAFDFTSH